MRKILPLLLLLIGIGGGVAAGLKLRPAPEADMAELANPCGDDDHATAKAKDPVKPEDREYVKMNNQFVVPVMAEGRVASLVVLSLSIEVPTGQREVVYAREPKLRDVVLQVLFDHANMGGFEGAFTSSHNMDVLRAALMEAARKVLGAQILDVLITDIARQDM